MYMKQIMYAFESKRFQGQFRCADFKYAVYHLQNFGKTILRIIHNFCLYASLQIKNRQIQVSPLLKHMILVECTQKSKRMNDSRLPNNHSFLRCQQFHFRYKASAHAHCCMNYISQRRKLAHFSPLLKIVLYFWITKWTQDTKI